MERYDYRSRAAREETALFLLQYAAAQRHAAQSRWDLVEDYYEGRHRTQGEIAESCRAAGIPWIAAIAPDPYIHVESQITAAPPDFVFRGREVGADPETLYQRAALVRYIAETQGLADQAPAHERRCILYGTAVWKVYWADGEVRIADTDPRAVYPDPAATRLADCEYFNYVYRVHRRQAARIYGPELAALGLPAGDLPAGMLPDGENSGEDGTLPVLEHWYRAEDGAVACSILVGGRELRHIPDYWRRTGHGQFPFVFQYRVARSDDIWGRSDLEPVLPLVDAVDRELALAQLQSAFTGSDIVLAEHDAFAEPPENRPGALWRLKPGGMGKVQRLGGLGNSENRLAMIQSLRELIQDTVGNYGVSMGQEPSRMLSASGLAQLIERADLRRASKKAERLRAYARLYALMDQTALEMLDGPLAFRLPGEGEERIFVYRPDALRDSGGRFPRVDCVVSTADGLQTSRAFLINVLESLLAHSITRENYPLVVTALRTLDMDGAEALAAHLAGIYGEPQAGETPESPAAAPENP